LVQRTFGDAPNVPVVSNVTAAPLTAATGLGDELVDQITSPVRWVDSVQTMLGGGATSFVEFGPGRVLTGLVRRIERGAELRNVGTTAEARGLEAAPEARA
jgi:[acyl-carrier-protein] S-malonyltransferase